MRAVQILVDGFAISSLYGLAAVGFTLIFGVSGVLNLAHGGIMVVAALVGWAAPAELGFGTYAGTLARCFGRTGDRLRDLLDCGASDPALACHPARKRPRSFVLTGTLLWGIMIQVGMAYLFSDNPVTIRPLIAGVVNILGVRTPANEILIAVIAWALIGLLWLLVNRTRTGKALLGASMNPRGVTLLGYELTRIYFVAWTIYGLLAGIAGVLLASFLGVSTANTGQLTASAFSIVVLGGLGSVSGSLIAAYVVGYLETMTAYLVAPTLRPIPSLILLVLVIYVRPQGLLGRR
jgi:branched-chain amino acid transport system permease protein